MSDKPTLFSDSEVFQKERPKTVTNQQLENFYKKIAEEIKKNGYSTSDLEEIIEDLEDLHPFIDTGYEMAKKLEDNWNADYEIDSGFIEYLEGLEWKYRNLIEENVKTWVKAHNPKPKFKVGDQILIDHSLCYGNNLEKGKTAYITGIKEDTACYLVDQNPNRKGGTILEFEKVEPKVTLINSQII